MALGYSVSRQGFRKRDQNIAQVAPGIVQSDGYVQPQGQYPANNGYMQAPMQQQQMGGGAFYPSVQQQPQMQMQGGYVQQQPQQMQGGYVQGAPQQYNQYGNGGAVEMPVMATAVPYNQQQGYGK